MKIHLANFGGNVTMLKSPAITYIKKDKWTAKWIAFFIIQSKVEYGSMNE
jgi:hypothetical protein